MNTIELNLNYPELTKKILKLRIANLNRDLRKEEQKLNRLIVLASNNDFKTKLFNNFVENEIHHDFENVNRQMVSLGSEILRSYQKIERRYQKIDVSAKQLIQMKAQYVAILNALN